MIGVKEYAIAAVALIIGAGAVAFVPQIGGAVYKATHRVEVENIVQNYILTHPEILPQAMAALQTRETKKIIDANRAQIETPYGKAWEGAADADVTLVQFFDYACGFCRASLPDIDRLIATDKHIRVVYRELPILGEPSLLAARASLNVAANGSDYAAFHRSLYAAGRPETAAINAALTKAGVSVNGTNLAKIDGEITANLDLQRQLQLTGTPSWVVGDTILNGAVGYEALQKAIATARAKRG